MVRDEPVRDALPVVLPPDHAGPGADLAGQGEAIREASPLLLHRRPAEGAREGGGQRRAHQAVRGVQQVHADEMRRGGQSVPRPGDHPQGDDELQVLPPGPRGLVHPAIDVRLSARRLHSRVLLPAHGLHAVLVVPPRGPRRVLGLHGGRERGCPEGQDRGRAVEHTGGEGGRAEEQGDRVNPETNLRAPERHELGVQRCGRRST